METRKDSDLDSNRNITKTLLASQIKQEDATFNKLKKIQSLLKKESALKNLCGNKNIFNIFNI